MTLRQFLAGLAGLLWLAVPSFAAGPERIARPQVEVRAGPSEKFPITATLQLGDPVHVRGPAANPGWMEIVPPAGSYSWISHLMIQQVAGAPQTVFVVGDDVPLRI